VSSATGVFGDQPVYIITGIKIAKGFVLEGGIESSKEATLGGSAAVPPAGRFILRCRGGWVAPEGDAELVPLRG
jgi:hypothetical protein